jgi:hypothetical protein
MVARGRLSPATSEEENYMENISRRRFLRDASIGAAALGAAAAVGQETIAKISKPVTGAMAPAALAPHLGGDSPREAKDEVMAHVVGGPSGTVKIYSGTSLVTIHDRSVANAILSAIR